MHETQYTINDWQFDTFGRSHNAARTATRLNEEVAELLTAVVLGDIISIHKELADVYIVLCCLAGELDLDLHHEVDAKMVVNRARTWVITDPGHGYHVKEPSS